MLRCFIALLSRTACVAESQVDGAPLRVVLGAYVHNEDTVLEFEEVCDRRCSTLVLTFVVADSGSCVCKVPLPPDEWSTKQVEAFAVAASHDYGMAGWPEVRCASSRHTLRIK